MSDEHKEIPKRPQKPRRAKRVADFHVRKKLGYNPHADQCGNCQFCHYRMITDPHRGKIPGRPQKSAVRLVHRHETRPKNGRRQNSTIIREMEFKYEANREHFCTLGWMRVNKGGICNFHVRSDTPLKEKERIHHQERGWSRRRHMLYKLLDLTIRELEGGVPRRPKRPETLAEIASYNIPARVIEYIDEYWELISDELYRYERELWDYRREYADIFAKLLDLREPEAREYERKYGDDTEMRMHLDALRRARRRGYKMPVFDWEGVMARITYLEDEKQS